MILGVHNLTESTVDKFHICTLPSTPPRCLQSFFLTNFNITELGVSFGHEDNNFGNDLYLGFSATLPTPLISSSIPEGIRPLYFLHRTDLDTSIMAGVMVIAPDSLCPQFVSAPNTNIFQNHFRIEFIADGHTYVRRISPFKFTLCFCFMDSLCYRLSHQDNWYALDAGIPALTTLCIIDASFDRLCQIWESNFEIFQPNQYAAPTAHIQAFLNSAIGTWLPDQSQWVCALKVDDKLATIR